MIEQYLLSGLTTGAIYALVALGFALIYNASHVINFAQGEFVMIGGMASAAFFDAGLPFRLPLALPLEPQPSSASFWKSLPSSRRATPRW